MHPITAQAVVAWRTEKLHAQADRRRVARGSRNPSRRARMPWKAPLFQRSRPAASHCA